MSLFEREDGDWRPWSFVHHDARHRDIMPDTPKTPRIPNPGDPDNRLDDEERRRLGSGGRNATRLSRDSAPASTGPAVTLSGLR
ncbi:MAG TPA: hypothetical protein VEA44_16155 [Caulobacter sp.]|nr:hypothetical protein [Caulobacter sp.]